MKSLKDYLTIFRTALNATQISFKAVPLLTSVYLGAHLIGGLLPVVLILLSKRILDEIVRLSVGGGSLNYIFTLLLTALGIQTLVNILMSVKFIAHKRIFDELSKYAQVTTMKQSLKLDMAYFESSEFFNQYERVRRNIDHVLPLCVSAAGEMVSLLLTLVSVSIVLVNIHWLLFPLIVLVNLPILLWGMGYSMVTYSLGSSQIPEARKADYLAQLATDKASVAEVKLFNLGNYFFDKYQRFFEKVLSQNWKAAKGQFGGAFLTSLISDLTYYIFFAWFV